MGRVVAYGYQSSVASFFAHDSTERIQRMAESLVQELRANRHFAGTLRRPIIFICHGLGGVIVKKSLVYSSTRTAPKVAHLWDQFVSTFAILFFGTPHGPSNKSNWLTLEKQKAGKRQSILRPGVTSARSSESAIQVSQAVDIDFSPHLKQFHMFFFWEQMPTDLGTHFDFIVSSDLAVPNLDNTETSGIHATHSGMVKFRSREKSDYRTVIAALQNYCEKAPRIISHRWNQAESALRQTRAGELWELGGFGFDVHLEEPYQHERVLGEQVHHEPQIRHFYPPQSTAAHFVGREDKLELLHKAFFPTEPKESARERKSFAIFGMGGSGKTELCSRYAECFKQR